jgi:hypothetical protein
MPGGIARPDAIAMCGLVPCGPDAMPNPPAATATALACFTCGVACTLPPLPSPLPFPLVAAASRLDASDAAAAAAAAAFSLSRLPVTAVHSESSPPAP